MKNALSKLTLAALKEMLRNTTISAGADSISAKQIQRAIAQKKLNGGAK